MSTRYWNTPAARARVPDPARQVRWLAIATGAALLSTCVSDLPPEIELVLMLLALRTMAVAAQRLRGSGVDRVAGLLGSEAGWRLELDSGEQRPVSFRVALRQSRLVCLRLSVRVSGGRYLWLVPDVADAEGWRGLQLALAGQAGVGDNTVSSASSAVSG